MIGNTLGRYEILEKIGEGAMGAVYRARDAARNRHVAVKILPPETASDRDRLERLLREARTISDLDHPYIVTIHSVEESDGIHFITMEILQGQRLSTLMPQNGFSAGRFFDTAIPLVDSIGAAQEVGVIPHHLNPENILMTNDGIAKILNFGLAQNTSAPGTNNGAELLNPELRGSGSPEGTPLYKSPEEVTGRPRDHRSDIYSLGAIFHEMLTGVLPSSKGNPDATPASVSERRRDLPESLGKLIARCLDENPDKRPESAKTVSDKLSGIRDDHLDHEEESNHSIVVLPFLDMSLEEDQDYLCDGITEAIINDLGDSRGLRVVSRISAFQFKDTELSVAEVGRRLDAGFVLKGTVKKADGRLRITAELFRASDGVQAWSEDYDRELKSIFDIQAEIIRSVEEALDSSTGPAQAPQTENVQAYEYYLRGRKFYYQYRRKSVELARRMFATAVRHDPEFALAHAGIADCCCFLYLYSEGRLESLEKAEAASSNALKLAPELAEVHASRGLALSLLEKQEAAETEFQTAIHLDPDLFQANYLYARHCFAHGQLVEAGKLFEKAAKVNPDDYQTLLLAAQVMESQGHRKEAEETRRKGVQLVEAQLRSHPGDVRALYLGANALAANGEKDRPLEWANLALVMEPHEPMVLYNAGCIYALCGKTEEAIESLEKAAKIGLAQKGWYENDTDLDPLRDHYRFKALMRWMEENHPD